MFVVCFKETGKKESQFFGEMAVSSGVPPQFQNVPAKGKNSQKRENKFQADDPEALWLKAFETWLGARFLVLLRFADGGGAKESNFPANFYSPLARF